VRDSGVLYHAVLPFEKNTGWMRSFECQVEEHDTGDYWGVAGAIADVRVRRMDDTDERRRAFETWRARNGVRGPALAYDPAGEVTTIRRGGLMKSHDDERPGWNTVDVYCAGDVSVHAVNGGAPNMVLTRLRQPAEGGGEAPLVRGRIQLQSEGAEVFYRRIRLRPLASLPAGLAPPQAAAALRR
jgi:hypothetical protein